MTSGTYEIQQATRSGAIDVSSPWTPIPEAKGLNEYEAVQAQNEYRAADHGMMFRIVPEAV